MKHSITVILFISPALLFSASLSAAPAATRTLFKKKCAMCHDLPNPKYYSRKAWHRHVRRMAQRAGLDRQELRRIKSLR